MGTGRALSKCKIVIVGNQKDWPLDKMQQWINNAGGSYATHIDDGTTHMVVHDRSWKAKVALVTQALELNKQGRDIKIVNYDWLDDSVNNRSKKRESPYLWERIDKTAIDAENKATKKKKDGNGDSGSKKGQMGMMAEVFQESTDIFVTEHERKRMERELEEHRRVKRELEEEAEKAAKEEKMKQAAIFRKGAKKARNEIFSDNHHIYTDDTGFKYDVLLTKVDTINNRNERWALTLQIYESNAEPHTYATNAQFAGTRLLPSNNVLAAIGCNFPTAFRVFKVCFKEKTNANWEDRVTAAIARRQLAETADAKAGLTVRDEQAEKEKFDKAPFEYYPPIYGPRGKDLKRSDNGSNSAEDEHSTSASKSRRRPSPLSTTNERLNHQSKLADPPLSNVADELDDTGETFNPADGENFHGTSYPFEYLPYQPDGFEPTASPAAERMDFSGGGAEKHGAADEDVLAQGVGHCDPELQALFDFGMQTVDETQIAEKAMLESDEYIEAQDTRDEASTPTTLEATTEKPRASLNLGTSILGKRKASSLEAGEAEQIGAADTGIDDRVFSFALDQQDMPMEVENEGGIEEEVVQGTGEADDMRDEEGFKEAGKEQESAVYETGMAQESGGADLLLSVDEDAELAHREDGEKEDLNAAADEQLLAESEVAET